MTTARKLAWLLLPILSSIACGKSVPEGTPPKPVFTEHRPQKAEKASKQLGEECTAAGASECHTGTCFHYKAAPQEGYVCSQKCQTDDSCPLRWSCISIYPGEGNRFCTPPQDWQPQATSVRVTALAAPASRSAPTAPAPREQGSHTNSPQN